MKRASLCVVSVALFGMSAFAGEPIAEQKPATPTAKASPTPTPAPASKVAASTKTEKTSPTLDRLFDSQTAATHRPEIKISGSFSVDTFVSFR